jgi:hypothetical protein
MTSISPLGAGSRRRAPASAATSSRARAWWSRSERST